MQGYPEDTLGTHTAESGVQGSYHQLEFEVRTYLTHLHAGGARLWDGDTPGVA